MLQGRQQRPTREGPVKLVQWLALPAFLLCHAAALAQEPEAARRNLVVGAAAAAAEAPPRTIADIQAMLDQFKPDPARVARLRAELEKKPPAGGDSVDMMRFHERRAALEAELGMGEERVADMREALKFAQGSGDRERHVPPLAAAEMQQGNFSTAAQLYEGLLATMQGRPGPSIVANLILSRIYSFQGDTQRMQVAFRRGDAVFEKVRNAPAFPRANVPRFSAMREFARGDLLIAEGKLAESEAALRKALGFYEEVFKVKVEDDDAPTGFVESYFACQSRLVQVLTFQGKLQEAELAARSVLRAVLSRSGKYSTRTGFILSRFAEVLNEQGRFTEAAAMTDAALEIFEKSGAPERSVFRSFALVAKANALLGKGDWRASALTFRSIRERAQGDEVAEQIFRGSSGSSLAMIKAGRAADVLPNTRVLLDRTVATLGVDHPKSGEFRGIYAMGLYATGDRPGALREFRDAARVLFAPGAASTELTGLALRRVKVRQIVESYLSLLHEVRGTDLERTARIDAASESFRMADALLGEGSVQRALAASAARAAASQPGLGELIREEQDGKQEIATLYDHLLRLMAMPADQQLPKVLADMRARITQLEKSRQQLYANIERRFPDYATLVNPRPGTLEDARRALKPAEALVSVLSTPERSFVWAVNSRGEVSFHMASLPESDIAAVVARLRKSLDPGDVPLTRLPAYDFEGAHRIYAELFAPAEKVWGSAQTLVTSVGGALSQIPLAILPMRMPAAAKAGVLFGDMASVEWLVKKVAVVDVPSVAAFARLRSLPAPSAKRTAFAGFGDPQFGKVSSQLAGGTTRGVHLRNLQISRVSDVQPAEAAQAAPGQAAAPETGGAWTQYANLTPLPDTREEILAIAQALGADMKSDVFLGVDASKRRVMKTDLDNRRIVAFATHGLIAGDLPGLDQPALALAGADDPDESPLLTLDDVLNLKLNADWVVLSACNTAAGDGEGAEAVSGLGRGFFYAGTRALLVTHWPVETVSARKLTTRLFERYAQDPQLSRAQALRGSMLALMTEQAQGYSYAHPLFWAPYALIGDGGR
jgi:CHAT domain-containing protein